MKMTYMRSEVLTAVIIKIAVFRYVMTSHPLTELQ
jgi:hypothetical protein